MKIKIIAVGKIKEKYFTVGIEEYLKRLKPLCDLSLMEVKEVNTNDISKNKAEEAKNILAKIDENDYLITLEVKGKMIDSITLASFIKDHYTFSSKVLTFIIGGSDGLDDAVINKSQMHLSFSEFTFPHQLMRLILCEQIYRAMMIINNKPYHK